MYKYRKPSGFSLVLLPKI